MQNGLGNVFVTVFVVAFSCVGATHFSIRIFANTLWMISLGVFEGLVFAVLGAISALHPPWNLQAFLGN